MAITGVCVPLSRLTQCVLETRADNDRLGLVAPTVGHVGDGNFHVLLSTDETDAMETKQYEDFNDRLISRALAMEGTCTGEHGIGVGKRTKLVDELGEETVSVMRAVKAAIDPGNIMNPGKILLR